METRTDSFLDSAVVALGRRDMFIGCYICHLDSPFILEFIKKGLELSITSDLGDLKAIGVVHSEDIIQCCK